jgi:DNA polymerase III sliding clamp (beta) subunit (PCNA family)
VRAKPEDWRDVPAGFKEACERASIAVANDETNRTLSAVFIRGQHVYGCDGKRAVRCKVEGLDCKQMLITKKTVREIVKLGNPKRMAVAHSMVLFDYSNLLLLARLREAGEYPNMDSFFDKRKATQVIPDGFGRAMARLAMFSGSTPMVVLDNSGLMFLMSAEGPHGSATETLPKFEEEIPKRGIAPDLVSAFLPFAELIHFGSQINEPYYFNGETAGFEGILMPMTA